MVGALEKHLQRKTDVKELQEENTVGYVKVPVLADGRCFWHCLLRVSLPEEYDGIDRSSSGGPRNKNQLDKEVETAKTAVSEFMALATRSENHEKYKDILKSLQESPQVEVYHLQDICFLSGLSLRVSVSPEAGLWPYASALTHIEYWNI